jgi:hypothetical protein
MPQDVRFVLVEYLQKEFIARMGMGDNIAIHKDTIAQ